MIVKVKCEQCQVELNWPMSGKGNLGDLPPKERGKLNAACIVLKERLPSGPVLGSVEDFCGDIQTAMAEALKLRKDRKE